MVQLFPFRHHVLHADVGKLPHHCNDDVANYYESLVKGLNNLEKAARTDFMSFAFIGLGIYFLRSTHSGALSLVEKLRLPSSAKGQEWLNQYMDETVKLLDVCNVLKAGVSGLEHYQMVVELLVRNLDVQGDLTHQGHRGLSSVDACKREMLRIENDHKNLIETKIEAEGKLTVNLVDKHVENKFIRWNGFWGVLFALQNTSSYVCRLLLSAIVYVGPIPPLTADAVSVKSAWCCSLVRLHQCVNEQIEKNRSARKCVSVLSKEVEILEGALADLRAQLQLVIMRGSAWRTEDLEKFKQTVQSLKQSSEMFQIGMETVDWHVNDFFDEIVQGRNKLLNMFSNSTK